MTGVGYIQRPSGAAGSRQTQGSGIDPSEVLHALDSVDPSQLHGEALHILGASDGFETAGTGTVRIDAPTPASLVTEDLLRRFPGVYLAEDHQDPRLDAFIQENLDRFHAAGLQVLGLQDIDQRSSDLIRAAEDRGMAVVPVRVAEGDKPAYGTEALTRALAERPGAKMLLVGPNSGDRELPMLKPADPMAHPGPHYSLDGGALVSSGAGKSFEVLHTDPFETFTAEAADLWRSRGNEDQAASYDALGRSLEGLRSGGISAEQVALHVESLRPTADEFDVPVLDALQHQLASSAF